MELFEMESMSSSQFDPLRLKKTTWNGYKSGELQLHCMECPLARVLAILPKGSRIPTEDWGPLFQWFGPSASGQPWRVFWFGSTVLRKFPSHGAVAAEHLNGGYTQACSTRGIFIYRMEEATRVLIHEMLHAACLDPPNETIPVREATVETWAELILVAYRSKGFLGKAEQLWTQQAQWVADTN